MFHQTAVTQIVTSYANGLPHHHLHTQHTLWLCNQALLLYLEWHVR